jgi:transcriptional repressor NrdR
VIKKDGRREVFDRQKIISGIQRACEKRPVSIATIEKVVDQMEVKLQESGEKEIAASRIGEVIMQELQSLDEVAYVRFASVYRQFRDINEFMSELTDILSKGPAK